MRKIPRALSLDFGTNDSVPTERVTLELKYVYNSSYLSFMDY